MTPKKLILMLRDNDPKAAEEAIKFLNELIEELPQGNAYECTDGTDTYYNASTGTLDIEAMFDEGYTKVFSTPLISAFWLKKEHENTKAALENVPLGHVIKSEGIFMIKQVQNYFVRLTGDQAGLMIAASSIGKWEYLGELTNIETKKLAASIELSLRN